MKVITHHPTETEAAILVSEQESAAINSITLKLNAAASRSKFNGGWGERKNDLEFKICALALIHSEVSEALEALRVNDEENFREEVIDVIIRCFDLAGAIGMEPGDILANKHAYNVIERPRVQGEKHGGKLF